MPDPVGVQNDFERAMAGLAYIAYASLEAGHINSAMVIIAAVHKYLLERADIDLPPAVTQMERLTQEGYNYIASHPVPEW